MYILKSNLYAALIILFFSSVSHATNVVFFSPQNKSEEHPFWSLQTEIAQAAADDLDLNFIHIDSTGIRYFWFKELEKLLSSKIKIDYIVIHMFTSKTVETFQLLEDYKIPFITIERNIKPKVIDTLMKPGEKYKYWIGEVYYSEQHSGALLTQTLIEEARLNDQISYQFLAFSGGWGEVSKNRTKGLKNTLKDDNQTQLNQVVPTEWLPKNVVIMLPKLLIRYPMTNIIWAASDDLAIAAYKTLKQIGFKKKVTIGGIDWSLAGIKSVLDKKISASIGGHFMQSAWALVKIYDHSHNIQLQTQDIGKPLYATAIHQRNINDYRILLNNPDWSKINFKQFSLYHNKKTVYDFNIKNVLNNLKD